MDIFYAESMDFEGASATEAQPKPLPLDYDISNMQSHGDIERGSHSNQDVTQYVSKVQQAGKYLSQIVHTNECRGHCSNECMARFRLINHSISCNNGGSCVIVGCNTTKQLIRHRENCYREEHAARSLGIEKRECLICTIAYKYIGGTYCETTMSQPKSSLKTSSPLATTPNTVTSFESHASPRHQRFSSPEFTAPKEMLLERSYGIASSHGSFMQAEVDDTRNKTRHYSVDDSKRDHEFAIPTMLPKRFRRASGSDLELIHSASEPYLNAMEATNSYSANQSGYPPTNHYRGSI